MLHFRIVIIIALASIIGCSEPCIIPTELPTGNIVRGLKAGSLITYESTITDSNIRIFQRPPWEEQVLTFGATIGGRDSVLATESQEDRTMRFQDIDASTFYQYMPLGVEQDVLKAGFWLRLPLGADTLIQEVTDSSEWRHKIVVTYKSYCVGSEMQTIDEKKYTVKRIQTDYSWDDRELNDALVHHELRIFTNVQPQLGIFTEQTSSYANGRPRSHIIVQKIEL